MAAKTVTQLPVGPGWSFEPKYDGFRALAFAGPGGVVLQSRQLRDLTPAFPDVAAAVEQLGEVVVDGELVVWRAGRFDFAALQDRLRSGRTRVRGLVAAEPAAYVVFDLLARNGKDLRDRPYWKRRRKLEKLLGGAPARWAGAHPGHHRTRRSPAAGCSPTPAPVWRVWSPSGSTSPTGLVCGAGRSCAPGSPPRPSSAGSPGRFTRRRS